MDPWGLGLNEKDGVSQASALLALCFLTPGAVCSVTSGSQEDDFLAVVHCAHDLNWLVRYLSQQQDKSPNSSHPNRRHSQEEAHDFFSKCDKSRQANLQDESGQSYREEES